MDAFSSEALMTILISKISLGSVVTGQILFGNKSITCNSFSFNLSCLKEAKVSWATNFVAF